MSSEIDVQQINFTTLRLCLQLLLFRDVLPPFLESLHKRAVQKTKIHVVY
jgi:hypothetical protein